MKMDKIVVFSNDNFDYRNNLIYYQNKNTQTIIDILSEKFNILLVSKKNRQRTTDKKKFKYLKFNNIYNLLKSIIRNRNLKFLFISITPFNFFYFIILKLFFVKKKNIFFFLRSDGFLEYTIKFSVIGYIVYFLMFELFSLGSQTLSCSKNFKRLKKFKILLPSELDNIWFKKNFNKKLKKKISILYVGRFRKEKGYQSLIEIFKKMNKKIDNYYLNLTLVGGDKKIKFIEKNIKALGHISSNLKLRRLYDSHQILVLPSYTEGFPQVILEGFSRKKPVIVFEEIKFLKKIYPNGLFVSKRNEFSFANKIMHIIRNYNTILNEIDKIDLVTKKKYKTNLLQTLKN